METRNTLMNCIQSLQLPVNLRYGLESCIDTGINDFCGLFCSLLEINSASKMNKENHLDLISKIVSLPEFHDRNKIHNPEIFFESAIKFRPSDISVTEIVSKIVSSIPDMTDEDMSKLMDKAKPFLRNNGKGDNCSNRIPLAL